MVNAADAPSATSTSHILLKSVPLSLRAMFNEYSQLGNRIRKHYISPGVFLCLVTGRFVPPIHRRNLYSLQYSMLPAQRVGVAELWERLKEGAEERPSGSGAKYEAGGGLGGKQQTWNGSGRRNGAIHGKNYGIRGRGVDL